MIISIWDNDTTIDRFTVVFDNIIDNRNECICLGLYPEVFAQYDICDIGDHLGKRITLKDLPNNVRTYILDNFGGVRCD